MSQHIFTKKCTGGAVMCKKELTLVRVMNVAHWTVFESVALINVILLLLPTLPKKLLYRFCVHH